jgi:hypothetical protein
MPPVINQDVSKCVMFESLYSLRYDLPDNAWFYTLHHASQLDVAANFRTARSVCPWAGILDS